MGMFHEYLTNIYLLGGKKLTFTDIVVILTDIAVYILDFEFPLASALFPYDSPYLACGSNSYNPYECVRGSKSSPTFLVESDRGLW